MMENTPSGSQHIDLRGTPCPLNFIRCKLALEHLQPNEYLEIEIDKGEPENMVLPGLKEAGHHVQIIHEDSTWIKFLVVCGAR